eukprot:3257868-Alexandrium_andersonii.AAC.1
MCIRDSSLRPQGPLRVHMPRPIHAWGCLADPLQGWPDSARLRGDPQHLGEPRVGARAPCHLADWSSRQGLPPLLR